LMSAAAIGHFDDELPGPELTGRIHR